MSIRMHFACRSVRGRWLGRFNALEVSEDGDCIIRLVGDLDDRAGVAWSFLEEGPVSLARIYGCHGVEFRAWTTHHGNMVWDSGVCSKADAAHIVEVLVKSHHWTVEERPTAPGWYSDALAAEPAVGIAEVEYDDDSEYGDDAIECDGCGCVGCSGECMA